VSWNNTIQGSAGAFDAVVLAASPQACAGGAIAEHFRLELCSGAALGVLHAQGHGYATSRSATGAWFVASGGLRLVASTGIPWALDIGAVFPLRVPSIRADTGGASVYRDPDPQGAMVAAGPVVIF
jgi:hypothetical protein